MKKVVIIFLLVIVIISVAGCVSKNLSYETYATNPEGGYFGEMEFVLGNNEEIVKKDKKSKTIEWYGEKYVCEYKYSFVKDLPGDGTEEDIYKSESDNVFLSYTILNGKEKITCFHCPKGDGISDDDEETEKNRATEEAKKIYALFLGKLPKCDITVEKKEPGPSNRYEVYYVRFCERNKSYGGTFFTAEVSENGRVVEFWVNNPNLLVNKKNVRFDEEKVLDIVEKKFIESFPQSGMTLESYDMKCESFYLDKNGNVYAGTAVTVYTDNEENACTNGRSIYYRTKVGHISR